MCEELETVKRKRTEVEKTIKDLRKSCEKKTLKAVKNQDLTSLYKAAAFNALKAVNEKKKKNLIIPS